MFGTAVNRPVTQSLFKLITGEKAIGHLADLTISTLIQTTLFGYPVKVDEMLVIPSHHY